MSSHQNNSLFSSSQDLIDTLVEIISLEYGQTGQAWMAIAQLRTLFYKKYGVPLKVVAREGNYGDRLKRLLKNSGRFSIYSTPNPQNFYVALSQITVPNSQQNSTRRKQSKPKLRCEDNTKKLKKDID